MIVLVCGGRNFAVNNDFERSMLFAKMDTLHKERPIDIVIEGGANGADAAVNIWAQRNNIHVATVSAYWGSLGRKAGPMRNQAMLKLRPDLVVAFPGGKGTANMVDIARKAGIEVIEA